MKKSLLIAFVWLLVAGDQPGLPVSPVVAAPATAATAATPHREAAQQQIPAQPGDASAKAPQPRAADHDLVLGEAVFTNTCLSCHGKGLHDAPVLGNAGDWAPRLKQDLDTLIGHAIHGHRDMPPKGGFSQLSDSEVAAAVAYAVHHGEKILAAMQKEQDAPRCDPVNNLDKCSTSEIRDMLTIQMLWLLGGKGGE